MPNIHQALLVGAPVEKVYNALTTQEGLAAWWTPTATARAEVGSISRFPFGPSYFKEMRINRLKPYEWVGWECIQGDAEWVGTTLSFRLISGDKEELLRSHPAIRGQIEQLSGGSGTLVVFHHNDWREHTLMFAECSYTWGRFLRSLKLYCETGKGTPW